MYLAEANEKLYSDRDKSWPIFLDSSDQCEALELCHLSDCLDSNSPEGLLFL